MFALGTAQLGVNYGINNVAGLPDNNEVKRILELAWDGGVRWLDTASSYGDSEEKIGAFLSEEPYKKFSVVTKLPTALNSINDAQKALEQSLARLQVRQIDCLMLHNTEHIQRLATDLGHFLLEKRNSGIVGEIGVSVYSPSQLLEVAKYPFVSAIQFPASLLDQRFLDSKIYDVLCSKRIFVRSVYLQGLLLMSEEDIVRRLPIASRYLKDWHTFPQRLHMTKQQLALAWIKRAFPQATPLIGCESAEQLIANLKVWQQSEIDQQTFAILSNLKCDNEDVILPTNWNKN